VRSIVDTHSHLDTEAFDNDRLLVIESALRSNVHAIVLIGYEPARWESTSRLCQDYPLFVRAVGIHPNSASMWSTEVEGLLGAQIALGNDVAVGEIGLDFFREYARPEVQMIAFRSQLEMAKQAGLPVIIHQRSAEQATLAVLEEFAPLRGVMHCFSGDEAYAQRCIELGMHLGVGGVITYPRSESVRAAVQSIPLDSLVLETDAPYLAPHGQRGKRNEPAFIQAAANTLASIFNRSPDDVVHATTSNALRLFGPLLERALSAGQGIAQCHS
jgi:TatD DNase family protein